MTTALDTELDVMICRHCGEALRDDDGTMTDRNGDDGCPMAERHEAVR